MNIYGAGGHAKVIIDIIHSRNLEVSYVFDDKLTLKEIMGFSVNHNPSEELFRKTSTVVAIGDNEIRRRIAKKIKGEIALPLAHICSVVSPSVKMGRGTVVMANAAINAEAVIGDHCIVNTGAVVEHNVIIEDYVHISPNAVITGNVFIKEGTQIGAGACIIPGIKIGKWAVVGAGAVIIEDIPDYATVVGNPGRILKLNEKS